VFHGFGQAKFPYGGSVFRLEPIYTTAPAAASENNAQFKSGENQIKRNGVILFGRLKK